MLEVVSSFFIAFTALFVVVDPVGVIPIFAALTHDRPAGETRQIAWRACLVGTVLLALFSLGGRLLLEALHIRMDSFRMAGGLLLLFTALDMLHAQIGANRFTPGEVADAGDKEDIAIVPMAIPLLAGPGSMATVMMLTARSPGLWGKTAVLAAIAATFLLSYLMLRSAAPLQNALGPSVMAVVQRVAGLILAAMAIQFLVEGALGLVRLATTT